MQHLNKKLLIFFAEDIYVDKKRQIEKVLSSEYVDIDRLREFAISPGGFVTDELRQKAWPIMVGVDVDNIPPKPGEFVQISNPTGQK